MVKPFDICIRGTGMVGRILALLLAQSRFRVALTGSPLTADAAALDVRAFALNAASRYALESIRCWPADDQVTAVRYMRVHGDQQSGVHFDAADLEAPALAWIADVPALEARLATAIGYQPNIEWSAEPVNAALTAICEGRSSLTRDELGVEFVTSPYQHTAIAARVHCGNAHVQTARQWFSEGEILALLPLGGEAGREMALVWSVPPVRAAELMALSDEDFAQELNRKSAGAGGNVEVSGKRAAWPLQFSLAQRWSGRFSDSQSAWVLVGDAAHAVHPLSGQGLNLGIADAVALAEILAKRAAWKPVSDQRTLRHYTRQRKAASIPMRTGTDLLAQLFEQQQPAWKSLRSLGLQGFDRSGPLKRWAARQAMNSPPPFLTLPGFEET